MKGLRQLERRAAITRRVERNTWDRYREVGDDPDGTDDLDTIYNRWDRAQKRNYKAYSEYERSSRRVTSIRYYSIIIVLLIALAIVVWLRYF